MASPPRSPSPLPDYESFEDLTPLYKPVVDNGEIRLVHLQPGDVNDKVDFVIKHANLDYCPSYEALSYVWGEPNDPSDTAAEESLLSTYKVQANLRSALFHLRHKHQKRIIWIDALCINQQDVNERNHQVRQMGRIYGSATRVVAWLGEPTASSSLAMMFLSVFYRNRNAPPISDNFRHTYFDGRLHLTEVSELLDYSTQSLWRSKYWSRLWIIQEVLLARDIYIQSGFDVLEWKFMSFYLTKSLSGGIEVCGGTKALDFYPRGRGAGLPITIDMGTHLLEQIWEDKKREEEIGTWSKGSNTKSTITEPGLDLLDLITTRFQNRENSNMCDLVKRWRHSECKDPRDRAFGFYNLTLKCCQDAIGVDYSLDISQIAGKIAVHSFQQHEAQKQHFGQDNIWIGSREMWLRHLKNIIESWMHGVDKKSYNSDVKES